MKKITLVALIIGLSSYSFAQQLDLRKKITVSGTVEKEVIPDEIYISISLKEYLKDNNAKKKVDIVTLENQLFTALSKVKIAKENLRINDVSSWNYNYFNRKNSDFLASKEYLIKLSDLNGYNEILAEIDPKGIQSTNINHLEYSKTESLIKELQIRAIQKAKEKATYLVEAIGQKLGSAINIDEEYERSMVMSKNRTSNVFMASSLAEEEAHSPEIDIKMIKLKRTVTVVFEVQ